MFEIMAELHISAPKLIERRKYLPIALTGVPGTGPSFLGPTESRRCGIRVGFRGMVGCPPDPVRFIDSPPAKSDALPGIGEGTVPFTAPTFRICARTWRNCRS